MRHKPPRRRVVAQLRGDRSDAKAPNETWSMDFVHDQTFDGQRLRVLAIIDNHTRICPTLDVRRGYKGEDVAATLDKAISAFGKSQRIYLDNGPEFVTKELDLWAYANNVILDFSRPGKPTDNAFIESFNSRFRQECLKQNWFLDMADARQKIEAWREEYNHFGPHGMLGNLTPLEYLLKCSNDTG